MVERYICPGCGGDMLYDAATRQMKCPYCETTMPVSELSKNDGSSSEKNVESEGADFHVENGDEVVDESDTSWDETIDVKVYKCPSCGAEILTDDETAATFCGFCGRPSMMEDRLSGEKKPAYVIPFRITKDAAVETYTAWAKKGIFTPGLFHSKSTIEKITGIYVPFWLYDYNAEIMLEAAATRTRSERKGDYRYVHTDHFKIIRDVETDYIKIPADASEKMDDRVMDMLEPFNYGEMTEFDMAYLSGYYAEKYTYTGEDMFPRIENRVKNYINKAAMDTIIGYATVTPVSRNVRLTRRQMKYALLPVWILNCTYNGKEFMFAMNGQTGKIVAEKPISKKRVACWWGGLAAGIFGILFSVGRFLIW